MYYINNRYYPRSLYVYNWWIQKTWCKTSRLFRRQPEKAMIPTREIGSRVTRFLVGKLAFKWRASARPTSTNYDFLSPVIILKHTHILSRSRDSRVHLPYGDSRSRLEQRSFPVRLSAVSPEEFFFRALLMMTDRKKWTVAEETFSVQAIQPKNCQPTTGRPVCQPRLR